MARLPMESKTPIWSLTLPGGLQSHVRPAVGDPVRAGPPRAQMAGHAGMEQVEVGSDLEARK